NVYGGFESDGRLAEELWGRESGDGIDRRVLGSGIEEGGGKRMYSDIGSPGGPKCYFAVRLYGTAGGNRFFWVGACWIEDCLPVLQGLTRADYPEWRFLHLSALKRIQNPQQPQAASRVPPYQSLYLLMPRSPLFQYRPSRVA